MLVILIGPSQPRDPVHKWLKASCCADVAHFVTWRGGDELRASCQAVMDVCRATVARCGVRLCETCLSNLLSKERYAHAARRQKGR
jgi:hypothetical protein